MAHEDDAFRDWHRLFGMMLTDLFTDSPFEVEVEYDLSRQAQLLDVIIVRRKRGKLTGHLPDGMCDLADHNLITFKSLRESLDTWAIQELLAHYVAYRKLVSPSTTDLLDEERFKLFGICSRFPHNLAGQLPWHEAQAGVYDCRWGVKEVRVIVAGELPQEPQNAGLHLFSASLSLVGYGQEYYRRRSQDTSLLLSQLCDRLRGEGMAMAFTMEDFRREYFKEHFGRLPAEEKQQVLKEMSAEDRREFLMKLPAEDRREFLMKLPAKDRQEILMEWVAENQQQVLKAIPLESRFADIPPDQLQEYLDRLTKERPRATRKPRRKQ